MTNRMRTTTAPGLALIGDAALATDPLFGVGCGWAFQSAEWLGRFGRPGAARRRARWKRGCAATGAPTRATCAATPA